MSQPPPSFSESPPPEELRPSAAPPDAPEEPAKRPRMTAYVGLPPDIGWGPLTVMLGVLTAIGITIFGSVPIALLDPDLESTAAKDAAQLMLVLGLVGGALIFAAVDARGSIREALRRLGFRGLAIRAVGLAALAWLAYVGLAAIAAPLLQPEQEDITRELGSADKTALNLVVTGFLIVIAAPIAEELFFRGFMFAGLRNAMPIWPAAVISAVVWGSLHLTGGNIGVAVQLAIFGIVLAWIYERSGTLWVPIIAHGINNAIAFVLLATDAI